MLTQKEVLCTEISKILELSPESVENLYKLKISALKEILDSIHKIKGSWGK